MGTRSLTKIYNGDLEVFCMYKQYDGYVEEPGLGSELKQLMQDYVDNCSDFSAKAIESLIRAVYMSENIHNRDTQIEPVGTRNVGEEFTYRIYCDGSGQHPPMILYHYIDDMSNTTLLWSARHDNSEQREIDRDLVSNIQDWQR